MRPLSIRRTGFSLRPFAAAAGLVIAAIAGTPGVLAGPKTGLSEERRCRIEAPRLPAALAYCSTLRVPQHRAEQGGPALDLFVARVPALSAAPRPDPLVLIAGGPGQSAVDLYLQLRRAFEHVRRERDIVLLDQRGTGRSAQGFRCDLTEPAALDPADPDALRDAVRDCLRSLERDPRRFSTAPAVTDLDALRRELGVEQWNIYAISYGTRVAQLYAARNPERVRAMVLDGVVPADLVLGPGIAPAAQAALDGILERCESRAECAERYPDLPERFEGLQLRLASGPVSIDVAHPVTGKLETRLFSANELVSVVRLMSYSSQTASLLPLAISDAYGGDYSLLAAQVDILTADMTEALNMPMHNSVVCTEDVPFFPADARSGLERTYLGTTVIDALETICAEWPAAPPDPDMKAPLEFNRPVLLLSGELDPVTPPRYAADAIAGGLTNAVHVTVPGQGHGMAGVGCASRVIARFVETARPADVDAACLRAEPPAPFFLSTAGPAP